MDGASRGKPGGQAHSGLDHRSNIAIVFCFCSLQHKNLYFCRHQVIERRDLNHAIVSPVRLTDTSKANGAEERNLDVRLLGIGIGV